MSWSTIRDNGIGIAPEYLGSVFEMFMQVDRSNRRSQGGLGIGLTLVRSLVQMHGGTVAAHSAGPGQGSEFVVSLPALEATAAPRPSSGPPTRGASRRAAFSSSTTIATRRTRSARCSAARRRGEVAHGGQAALAALPAFAPDTVLLDIGMPEIDGYEVARRIRSDDRYAGILLIALTGWGQDSDYSQSGAAGFDHHLVKPPDIEELRAVLAGGFAASRNGELPDAQPGAPGRSVDGRHCRSPHA